MNKYILQTKNGNHSSWNSIGSYKKLDQAIKTCEQKCKQKRHATGTFWYKTRVVLEINSEFVRVYPPQKDKTGKSIKINE